MSDGAHLRPVMDAKFVFPETWRPLLDNPERPPGREYQVSCVASLKFKAVFQVVSWDPLVYYAVLQCQHGRVWRAKAVGTSIPSLVLDPNLMPGDHCIPCGRYHARSFPLERAFVRHFKTRGALCDDASITDNFVVPDINYFPPASSS